MSRTQYQLLRQGAKEKNAIIYPSYKKLQEEKKFCYPNNMKFTESFAEVKLQPFLNHTTSRIFKMQDSVLCNLSSDELVNLTFFYKWGMDGSSGQSQYKQKFMEEYENDSTIFLTSIVPLQLFSISESKGKIIILQNPRPSSTRYCRPIKFQFKKETSILIKEERNNVDEQIKHPQPLKIRISNDEEITITYEMKLTMVDGKVCNSLTGTSSSQVCYICGATPKMNDLEQVIKKEIDITTYEFGLSTLHAYIRFMECVLHVSYRLKIKKWQVTKDLKDEVNKRKVKIQQLLRTEIGILVDYPKQGGSGNSNDGNTARRFFQNPNIVSRITGFDCTIIARFSVILQALACGYAINVNAFHTYAFKTAQMFVSTYNWFYMPVTVHKILIHGSAVISAAILPIGQLSEEAQEARNKDFKAFREYHTRKCNRQDTNEDIFLRFMLSSDPVISSLRNLPSKRSLCIAPEVIKLLDTQINSQNISMLEQSDSEGEE